MLKALLIPLSYIIGIIISKFTKEELLIRKNWLKNWIYLLFFMIPAILLGDDTAILMICILNYIKSSYDLIYKTPIKAVILWNIIFILSGIIILVDWWNYLKIKSIIKTKAEKQQIIFEDGFYKISLKSEPKNNKANFELIKLLEKYFNKKVIKIMGSKSHEKLIELE